MCLMNAVMQALKHSLAPENEGQLQRMQLQAYAQLKHI